MIKENKMPIDVFVENQAKEVDEFILKIIKEKTDFKGDIGNMDEVDKYLIDNDFKLETSLNAISGHNYKIFKNDKLLSHFTIKSKMEKGEGSSIKCMMWLEEVCDEV